MNDSNHGKRHDRFDYAAWRRGWRSDYASLTARIREAKIHAKAAQRASGDGSAPSLQASLAALRGQARDMMERRAEVDRLRRDMAATMDFRRRPQEPAALAA